MHSQHAALRIASTRLDMHVLAVVDTFESVVTSSRRELEKVRIQTEFVSPAVRKAIESGGKPRTLGDYVSNVYMKQVADTCSRTHGARFIQTEKAVTHLQQQADSVRSTIMEISLLDDAVASSRRADEIWARFGNKILIPLTDSPGLSAICVPFIVFPASFLLVPRTE
ncbi:hypothetical protein C8R45DRAFT_516483 [Mycena sanguinolenta]|nr:hypothetical protein C8R45DRAFT_516483 [Mycena sanguinolenta]